MTSVKLIPNTDSVSECNSEAIFDHIKVNGSLPSLKTITMELELKTSDVRKLADSPNSNDYSGALIALGLPVESASLLNPHGRFDYLVESGIAKKLIDSLAYELGKEPGSLTQRDLRGNAVTKVMFGMKIGQTADLLIETGAVAGLHELKNWPQNWIESQESPKLYEMLKKELGITSSWPTAREVRKSKIGAKFMDHFGNGVDKMRKHFSDD